MAEFIPPDYSEAKETEIPNSPNIDVDEDDLISDCPSDDDDFDDEEETVAESLEEEYQRRQEELNKNLMTTSPFSPPTSPSPFGTGPTSAPSWGTTPASTPAWGSTGWQSTARPAPAWGSGSTQQSTWGNPSQAQVQQIDRSKKIVFCDFFDCIVEAIDAHGRPGYRPRDIYDVMPKFDVWEKLAAFNPEVIYILISDNMLPSSANGSNAWQIALNYFSCCVSSFLRMPFGNCKIVKGTLDQSKESMILKVIDSCRLDRDKAVSIGIYSGGPGMSNADRAAAEACGIAYVDLKELLSKMF